MPHGRSLRWRRGDAPLQAALERLADADILLVQGLPPTSDYRFKHALIQDAAYENLLKSRRQALHRRTAEVLRDHRESEFDLWKVTSFTLFSSRLTAEGSIYTVEMRQELG